MLKAIPATLAQRVRSVRNVTTSYATRIGFITLANGTIEGRVQLVHQHVTAWGSVSAHNVIPAVHAELTKEGGRICLLTTTEMTDAIHRESEVVQSTTIGWPQLVHQHVTDRGSISRCEVFCAIHTVLAEEKGAVLFLTTAKRADTDGVHCEFVCKWKEMLIFQDYETWLKC